MFESWFKPRRVTHIEEHEETSLQLNSEIYDLVVKIEQDLSELSKAVQQDNFVEKNAQCSELENKMLLLKSKVEAIMDQLRMIARIESELEDVVLINDEELLSDKIDTVEALSNHARDCAELLSHNPSISELRNETLNFLYQKVNEIINAVNRVTHDDEELRKLYKSLRKL